MLQTSVIIPTYNRAELVQRAIASVQAQSQRDFELIVVDDGSEDDTAAVVSRLPGVRFERIAHGGPGAARNAGIALARGERIAFLDSDDAWDPRFLEVMNAALDADPQAGFAYCDFISREEPGGQTRSLMASNKLNGHLLPRIFEACFITMGGALIHRRAITAAGPFDPTLEALEDWDFWMRVACLFPARYVDRRLLTIHVNTAAREHRSSDEVAGFRAKLEIQRRLRKRFPEATRPHRALFQRQEANLLRRLAQSGGIPPQSPL
jgi:glycosyltransferase involved in cell wall biosynthesis